MYVYLIGAGPGDPGLITCKGLRALSEADVVIYDYLAGDALLAHARPDAERIYVGKVAGDHAMSQADINQLLVDKARQGKVVARLKGGDPYIFGRGGEEAETLADAGVPFEEIPGVTSTIAAPACAGIPLTHRAAASSVTLITGHEDPAKPGSVHNWQALAQSSSTLVFVMGMKNLPDITRNLMDAGMKPDTPAALIHWGTTERQRSLASTLAGLPAAARREGFSNPSIIVVGEVVRLRDKLNWFEKRPLFGRAVVVTRAREQASDSVARFAALGARVIQFPTIEVRPLADQTGLDTALDQLSAYTWIIFTSVNGVRFFRERLEARGLDARALAGLKVAAIGPATATAVRALGVRPDFVPERYVAESAAEGLLALGAATGRVLLPRAREAREILPETLRRAGAEVDVVPVYETAPALGDRDEVLRLLNEGRLDCITFGSSSTVRNFLAAIPADLLKAHPETRLACIGPVTARTLACSGLRADIQPGEYTVPALVRAVADAFAGDTPGGGPEGRA
ncbi:MAG: uroporphyrinogen-III C-methyltransferase [Desulfovibrionaceae bacterium]|nr:uroporphyrinogen-III C-methyltransferase [Desulfovibrionaceae bacterium]